MTNEEAYIPAGAIVAILTAKVWESWYARYLYHGGYTHRELAPYFFIFLATLGTALYLLSRTKSGKTYIRATLLLTILYLSWRAFPYNKFFQEPFSLGTKVLLFILAVIIARHISLKGQDETWRKLCTAITAAVAIYSLTPYSLGLLSTVKNNQTLNFHNAPEIGYSHNLVAIIFDETSPEFTYQLLSKVSQHNIPISSFKVKSAGSDTINAIPSMLVGGHFDGVSPCGFTTLCGRSASIDFSKLSTFNSNVDVVGFWHPYCSINGLRTCYREAGIFLAEPRTAFFCLIPYVERFANCSLQKGAREAHLASLERAAMAAPFWKLGGTLLLHFPNPHPTMEGRRNNLAIEYLNNVNAASAFIDKTLILLRARFADDFSLVVTSDHPLRTEYWCKTSNNYLRSSCDDLPQGSHSVPFIVFNGGANLKPPASNTGIFGGAALVGSESGVTVP